MGRRYSPALPSRGARTLVRTSLTAAVGAIAGAAVMLLLKVGAIRDCIDLFQQPVSAACAAPAAAPWAVALGAIGGAVLAVFVTAFIASQRR